jgi:hypothetical protein
MHPERVERISNIKATAWTTILFFSLAGYLVFANYLLDAFFARGYTSGVSALEDRDLLHYIDRVMIVSLVVCLYISLIIYGAVGLLRLRLNGLILYHATTIVLVVMMILFAVYAVLQVNENPGAPHHEADSGFYFQMFKSISYEAVVLILAWVLVKVNLMLMRKEYRDEFS